MSILRRRALALLAVWTLALALLYAGATAATAVPEGWSDPRPVSYLTVLWMLVGIPAALFALVVLLVYLPSMVRSERTEPVAGHLEEQWIGGPRRGTRELAEPHDEGSGAGGARGTW